MTTHRSETPVGRPAAEGIASARFKDDPSLVFHNRPTSMFAERYRRLATKLRRANDGKPAQMVVVTSAAPSEGKTMTAVNLALALAESRDKTTLIVDGDLRRPGVSGVLRPRPTRGLSEVLSETASLEQVLVEVEGTRLVVFPAGASVRTPLKLFQLELLASLCTELRRRFDYIVVDTPPAVTFTDASVLSTLADGWLVVVRAGQTTMPMLDRALEALEGGRILGAVLNDVTITPIDRYYYRYDDYDPYRYTDGETADDSE